MVIASRDFARKTVHTYRRNNHCFTKSWLVSRKSITWILTSSQKEKFMFKTLAQMLVCLAIIAGATSITFAQASTGVLKGTVADANGAVIASATVEAVNDATSDKRTATSADDGTFTIPNLPVGIYTVTANATGFAPATNKKVKISVAFTTEVTLSLAVGGASANVTITSGDVQTQINNTDQQLSTLIDNK